MTWLRWLLSLFSRPQPPPAPVPPGSDPTGLRAAVNAARRSAGLPPLLSDSRLAAVAQAWAETMARTGVLSHGAFGGRIAAVYPGRACAENIAGGQQTAAAVVESWMDSPPHRANLLGDYAAVGCGRSGNYWVADFLE